MAHTPGPWRFEQDDECGMPEHDPTCRYIRDASNIPLMIGEKYYPSTPENIDDWRLIAAAPELLDALWETRRALYAEYYALFGERAAQHPSIQQADAAIAKAQSPDHLDTGSRGSA